MTIVHLFDLSKWKLWYDALPYSTGNQKPIVLKGWAEDEGADLVYNLCFFNLDTVANRRINAAGRTLQYLLAGGEIAGYDSGYTRPEGERLRIDDKNVVSGWNVAIMGGKLQKGLSNNRRSRNMHGMTTDGLYIVAQSTPATEKTVAQDVINYCKRYGKTVDKLLIMDGGGSVGCYSARAKLLFAPEKEGKYGREVASVLCAKYKGEPIERNLRYFSKGEDVKLLQTILGGIAADGSYGSGTRNRVKEAQKALGITADGSCGPITRAALKLNK